MRVIKWIVTIILGTLLLFDGIAVFRIVRYGWPKRLVGAPEGSMAQFHVVPIPMNASGWVAFALYVLMHVALCYLVLRLWRPSLRP